MNYLAPFAKTHNGKVVAIPNKRREPGEDDGDGKHRRITLRELLIAPTVESIRRDPPKRDYLMSVASTGAGVIVRGKVHLVGAFGGVGKTTIEFQRAVAIATGGTWLGWSVKEPGRVLLILGEEDAEECQIKLHNAARAQGAISDADLALIARNVRILPLAGRDATLSIPLNSDIARAGGLPETALAEEIRQLLAEAAREEAYAAVIIDPCSRAAAADLEKDSAASTRFVQVCETFTSPALGKPAVFLAHHLGKERIENRSRDPDSADAIRGPRALVDATRWAAILRQLPTIADAPDLLELRVVKRNYIRKLAPLILCRPPDMHGGCLRLATPEEIAVYEEAKSARSTSTSDATIEARVIAQLTHTPDSGNGLVAKLGTGRTATLGVIRKLKADGRVTSQGNKLYLPGTSGTTSTTSTSDTGIGTGTRPPSGAVPCTGTTVNGGKDA